MPLKFAYPKILTFTYRIINLCFYYLVYILGDNMSPVFIKKYPRMS